MVSFEFVDSHGTAWMIVAGLPADYPEIGEPDLLFAGLTFRSSTGQLRVLPRAAIPRRSSGDIVPAPPFGTWSRVRQLDPIDWEDWLRHALPWPPEPNI